MYIIGRCIYKSYSVSRIMDNVVLLAMKTF
jgi:hypothetical protein